MATTERDWSPFLLCPPDERPAKPRPIATPEGLGDRLRTAAFAELQAREAFRWASPASHMGVAQRYFPA